jgi:hypothetical protein
MKLILILAMAVGLSLVGLYLWGASLPATRQATITASLPVPSSIVYDVIKDVDSQTLWREDIKSIKRSEKGWEEVLKSGVVTSFELQTLTESDIHFTFKSQAGFEGFWTAKLNAQGNVTDITVTESATTKSPIGRIMSRLFFNPEKFTTAYIETLKAEAMRRYQTKMEMRK